MSHSSLQSFFKDNHRVAIACSGGTDSTFLVHTAVTLGADILPIVVRSRLSIPEEVEGAISFCRDEGVEPLVIDLDMLSEPSVARNGADRCYHCKMAMFTSVIQAAAANGYDVVADGTNASDPEEDRPGMRALRELGVRSPLREAGLSKSQIRRLSKSERLPTWNKMSNSCLATRVDEGVTLTPSLLDRVRDGEEALRSLGYDGFRVRTDGKTARVIMPASMWESAVSREDEIARALEPWFSNPHVSEETRDGRGGAQEAP